MLLQTPLGLYLPSGVRLTVDGVTAETLALQTCDTRGCYAGGKVSPELLAAMKNGTTLSIDFESLQRQPLNVPMTLSGFTASFAKIE